MAIISFHILYIYNKRYKTQFTTRKIYNLTAGNVLPNPAEIVLYYELFLIMPASELVPIPLKLRTNSDVSEPI